MFKTQLEIPPPLCYPEKVSLTQAKRKLYLCIKKYIQILELQFYRTSNSSSLYYKNTFCSVKYTI